jgi:sigma-B regulation protein RsbU (phosphoserine phosphatase)
MGESTIRASWVHMSSEDGHGVTGDFAETLDLGTDVFSVVVGDIAGKGRVASPYGRALCRFVRDALRDGGSPSASVVQTDLFFSRTLRCDDVPFASVFIAIVDLREHRVTYASAGHDTALLFGRGREHTRLEATGPVLGLAGFVTSTFDERTLPLNDAEAMVVVTDGITEARPPASCSRSFFGSAGVAHAFLAARNGRGDPARAVHDAAVAHSVGTLSDDASVIVSSMSRQWFRR